MQFINVGEIVPREIMPGFNGRFLHSEHITIAYWDIARGAEIPLHQHVHEMIVNVLDGRLELTVGEETRVLEAGMVVVIPSQVPHRARGLTDCRVLDVFYPLREDYR